MSPISSERSSEDPTVADWFRQMRLTVSPGLWLFLYVAVALGVYHLVWLLSAVPYTDTMAATVAVIVVVAAILAMLRRGPAHMMQTGVRLLLVLIGLGATVLGSAVMFRRAAVGGDVLTDIVGTVSFFAGLFVILAASYLHADETRPGPIPKPVSEQRLKLAGADALLRRFRDFGPGATDRIVDICRPLVSAADLHYVAYFVDHSCRFYLDVLDDSSLRSFFDMATPERRRDLYLAHGRYLDQLLTNLNQSFLEIDSGILIRVVLDVERGALFYYWVDDRRFIIGVTLNQAMVDKADRKMVHVVDGVRESLGHRKIGDLER